MIARVESRCTGGCCITDFVHSFYNGIESCIVPNGRIGAKQIIVDGAGQSYDGDVEFLCKHAGSGKSTVATNYHEGINVFIFHGLLYLKLLLLLLFRRLLHQLLLNVLSYTVPFLTVKMNRLRLPITNMPTKKIF